VQNVRTRFFVAVCLLGGATGSAHAQCNSGITVCTSEWRGGVINLGSPESIAFGINDVGQAVGTSVFGNAIHAIEWSGGKAIELGSLPGFSFSQPNAINNAGVAVGVTVNTSAGNNFGNNYATEWNGGKVINLGGLPGFGYSVAWDVNDAGQVVGASGLRGPTEATEWNGGKVINLGGLPGSTDSEADSINNAGVAVGVSVVGGVIHATEWSGRSIFNLGGLPGSTFSEARDINDAGQVVGASWIGGVVYATEWSGGSVIKLGGLPGSTDSQALGVNDGGQTAGYSAGLGFLSAIEWSGGSVIDLGGLPRSILSEATGINEAGQVVGFSDVPPMTAPEPSTWAMMLFGFGGLALAGYRRANAGRATLAHSTGRFSSASPPLKTPPATFICGSNPGPPHRLPTAPSQAVARGPPALEQAATSAFDRAARGRRGTAFVPEVGGREARQKALRSPCRGQSAADCLYEPAMRARLAERKDERDQLRSDGRDTRGSDLDVLLHPRLAAGYRQGLGATLVGALAALLSVCAEVCPAPRGGGRRAGNCRWLRGPATT
jgi:probable HAF family extracellular repeat protein